MFKTYKIRLLPTFEQERKLWEHVYACRYIWNYMLEKSRDMHYIKATKFCKELTRMKQETEYEWLRNVSNASLQQVCRNLELAYKRFFNHVSRHPCFKTKKRSKSTFPCRTEIFRVINGNYVVIEKVGRVLFKTDLNLTEQTKFHNVQICFENEKWIAVFKLECEKQVYSLNDCSMGIDLGIKTTATVAMGNEFFTFPNINKQHKIQCAEMRLKHLQRKSARKARQNSAQQKSRNQAKVDKQISKAFRRLRNIRIDYAHKITSAWVSLLPSRIVMEDLDVTAMMHNQAINTYVQNQSFFRLRMYTQYKCEERGILFVLADRFYPSSKTCSCCGYKKRDLKLSDRVFCCPVCGFILDRDINAAINLMNYSPS